MLKQHYYSYYSSSPSMNSVVMSSSSASAASWEEKAFAEDHAAGSSLGCIWPPRSYSCSFCMREFRSAQALGGHMNVHRRDRARLKQCLHHSNSTTTHHPPAPDHHQHRHGFAAFSPPPRAFLSSSGSFTAAAAAVSWSTDLSKVAAVMTSEEEGEEEEEEDCSNINIRLLGGEGEVETDLSVGLIHRGNRQSGSSSCKRPKIDNTAPFPFFLQSAEAYMEEEEEDLDLELRLGDPITPKVK